MEEMILKNYTSEHIILILFWDNKKERYLFMFYVIMQALSNPAVEMVRHTLWLSNALLSFLVGFYLFIIYLFNFLMINRWYFMYSIQPLCPPTLLKQ